MSSSANDLLHQIHARRAAVEPFGPLISDGLQNIHGQEVPPTIDLISSQSACKPSQEAVAQYATIMKATCPGFAELEALNSKLNEDKELQTTFAFMKTVGLNSLLQTYAETPEKHDATADNVIRLLQERRDQLIETSGSLLDEGAIASLRKGFSVTLLKSLLRVAIESAPGDEIELPPDYFAKLVELEKFEGELRVQLRDHLYADKQAFLKGYGDEVMQLQKAVHETAFKPLDAPSQELLDAATSYLRDTHGIATVDDGHLNLFNGGSYATLMAGVGLATGKKQVILTPELHWDGYNSLAHQVGSSLLEVPRGSDMENFLLENFKGKTYEKFVDAIRKKVGCILITHPCSITGKTSTDEELGQFLRIAKKYSLPLVVNEVYASPDHTGKPFNSITQHPEFKGAEDLVFISASLSKTFQQLHLGNNKLAMCWTRNQEWAEAARNLLTSYNRPFTLHDTAFDLAMFRGTPNAYFVENEQDYEAARDYIDRSMKKINQQFGKTVLDWSAEGYPRSGYMAALHINADSVAKAGITNVLDLWEYVYKVSGVNAGPVFFCDETMKSRSPSPMALRINYSVEPQNVKRGMEALCYAVECMDNGVTFDTVKKMQGPPRTEYASEALLQKMMAEYGGTRQAKDPSTGIDGRGA